MLLFWCLLIICLANFDTTESIYQRNLKDVMTVVHQWKYIDYDFGSDEQRQAAIKSGEYNHKSCSPIDVDRWRDKTFVTVIREKGVPSSLNVISDKTGPGGPLLQPYPDWSWAKLGNCSGITSVYRVAIDSCDKLWVLDTGKIDDKNICDAQLLAFDLRTSKLLKRVKIPHDIATNTTTGKGLLVTPIVQTFLRGCKHTNVFISDVEGYGLIVYNGKSFSRLSSSAFDFDPKATKYTIEGESFELEDGIVGMDLSARTQNLYFSPMSSYNLGFVNAQELTRLQNTYQEYRVAKDILWTQSSAKAVSRTGAVFFGLVNDTSIGCFNEYKGIRPNNIEIIARNSKTLQFTSGLKVKRSNFLNEELLAMTNRYQKIATGTINYDEINFRILRANVGRLIYETRCRPPNAMNTVLTGIIAFWV